MNEDIKMLFIYIIFIVILLIFWKHIFGFVGYGLLKGYNKDLKGDTDIDKFFETEIVLPSILPETIYPTPWDPE